MRSSQFVLASLAIALVFLLTGCSESGTDGGQSGGEDGEETSSDATEETGDGSGEETGDATAEETGEDVSEETGGGASCKSDADCSGLEVGICEVAICDAETSVCVPAHAPDGTACGDTGADLCAGDAICAAGECTTGEPVACESSEDPCLVNACDPETGACASGPAEDGIPCDDGDNCSSDDTCQAGSCAGGSWVMCENPGPCLTSFCTDDGECGAEPTNDGGECDDGVSCTENDACAEGVCVGSAIDCDDDEACTVDSCDEAGTCVNEAVVDGEVCDDGDGCTAGDACAEGQCASGENVCFDGYCCTTNAAPGCPANADVEACVCAEQPSCCEDSWSAECVQLANSEACGLGCVEDFGNSCCLPSEAPGCGDAEVQECTCALDSLCCDTAWDLFCVQTAKSDCELSCGGGEGTCCEESEGAGCGELVCETCVCALDSFCCDTQWDDSCTDYTIFDCGAECGCELPAGEGDCCSSLEITGCEEAECMTCVCAQDAFCCNTQWDNLCADQAGDDCADSCSCSASIVGSCCEPSTGAAGCTNEGCQDCICALDSFCCDTQWDDVCAGCANGGLCGADEATAVEGACNEACDSSCGEGGDCCAEKDTPGCDDPTCQEAICAADSFCCDNSWDDLCAGAAADQCEVCGGEPEEGGEGGASDSCEGKCGEFDEDAECQCDDECTGFGDCCDDYDALCSGEEEEGGDPGSCEGKCGEFDEDAECQCDDECESFGDCCDDYEALCSGEEEEGGDPGSCEGKCGEFESGASCQCDGECQDFDDCCDDYEALCVEDPELGDCCSVNGSADCEDVQCSADVCAQDDFCCLIDWDEVCVETAESLCAACDPGAPGEPGDCCAASETDALGCDDVICQACVCADDSFCCETAWDAVCAGTAADACAGDCACAGGTEGGESECDEDEDCSSPAFCDGDIAFGAQAGACIDNECLPAPGAPPIDCAAEGLVCEDGACISGETGEETGDETGGEEGPEGTVCTVTGASGEIFACFLKLARGSEGASFPAALQFDLSYDDVALSPVGFFSEVCIPNGPCFETPVPPNQLKTGHSLNMNPNDTSLWNGGVTALIANFADANKPLSEAYLAGGELVGEADFVELRFQLNEDLQTVPSHVTVSEVVVSATDASGLSTAVIDEVIVSSP